MQNTTNYNLRKPENTANYNVEDYNHNMDILDDELGKIYTVSQLISPKQNKIYNVFVSENTTNINGTNIYKEGTETPITLKANRVHSIYYNGTNFFLQS